jgi:hypothetical protein
VPERFVQQNFRNSASTITSGPIIAAVIVGDRKYFESRTRMGTGLREEVELGIIAY